MFKLLGGMKKSTASNEDGVDLDGNSKTIIQNMSSDSESSSPSPVATNDQPTEVNNVVSDKSNDIESSESAAKKVKKVKKVNKVKNVKSADKTSTKSVKAKAKKVIPSDDSSSDSDSSSSDDSIVIPKKANTDSSSSYSEDSSSESEEIPLPKPKKAAKTNPKNTVKPTKVADNKKKNNIQDNSPVPTKKIKLSEAKISSLKKDQANDKSGNDEIFCGGLPFSITEEQVRDLFEEDCGEIVKINVLEGKGIAFIKFIKDEFAAKAIEYDGTEFMGRKLRINLSSDKNNRVSTPRLGNSNNFAAANAPSNEICVRNINYKTTEDTMRELFSECGQVLRCHIPVYEDTGKPLGRCFISFASVEEATKALEYNNTDIDGRTVFISYAAPRGGRDGNAGSGFRGGRGGGGRGGGRGGGNAGPRPFKKSQANSEEILKPASKSIVFEDSD